MTKRYHKPNTNRRETLMIPGALKRIAEAHNNGEMSEAIKPAFDKLTLDAEIALDMPFHSVMDKETVPPSGSKHDYMSLSIYTWPDPNTPDGLPYRIVDGVVNPGVEKFDHPNMVRMLSAIPYRLHTV